MRASDVLQVYALHKCVTVAVRFMARGDLADGHPVDLEVRCW